MQTESISNSVVTIREALSSIVVLGIEEFVAAVMCCM